MAITHVLTRVDTLQALALKYLGDPASWTVISDYNNLDSPYILCDEEDKYQFYGSGYVTIVRADVTNSIVIPKGYQFKTKTTLFEGIVSRTFEVTEDTVVNTGVATAYIPLRCTAPGTFGNVMEYMITEVGENEPTILKDVVFLAIYNESCFIGGRDLNILMAGDTIYIPASSTEYSITQNSISDYINGEDLVLDSDGSLVIGDDGDLASVSGAANVSYAINARLRTTLGELVMHPEYGSELQDLIGQPNLACNDKLKAVAIGRALALEERTKSEEVNSIVNKTTTSIIDITYTLVSDSTTSRVNVTV